MSDAETRTAQEQGQDAAPEPGDEPEVGWWHRSHPTFAGLVGFFTGMAFTILVPGIFAAILGLIFSVQKAQDLFPFVLLALVVPIALLVPRKTRRFAEFMLIGIGATLLVVAVTTVVVLAILLNFDK